MDTNLCLTGHLTLMLLQAYVLCHPPLLKSSVPPYLHKTQTLPKVCSLWTSLALSVTICQVDFFPVINISVLQFPLVFPLLQPPDVSALMTGLYRQKGLGSSHSFIAFYLSVWGQLLHQSSPGLPMNLT